MKEAGALSFVEALHDRVEDILDACTRHCHGNWVGSQPYRIE
jgi:hypothetical protein